MGSSRDISSEGNADEVRSKYRELTAEEKLAVSAVKAAGQAYLDALAKYCHPKRETSLAVTKAEESVMWATKGITQ